MTQKKKHQTPQINLSADSLKHAADRIVSMITVHRFVLLFIILGAALVFALLETRRYIDIPRNETLYQEEITKINYKRIDKELLDSFDDARNDQAVEVDTQFTPDRTNPFTE